MFGGIARNEFSGDQWMEVRQKQLAENGALSAAELKQRFAEADAALVQTFKSLSPEELQAKRRHPAMGEIPVGQFVNMRISEALIHAWDVQSVLDPSAKLSGPATGPVLGFMLNVWPSWFLPEAIEGLQRTFRFVIGGAANEDRTLVISGGKAAWGSGTPDATFTLDPGDMLLLVSGRLSSEALIAGRAQISGDAEVAKGLSQLFKAYGGR